MRNILKLLLVLAATSAYAQQVFPPSSGGPCTISGSATNGYVLTATSGGANPTCSWQTVGSASVSAATIASAEYLTDSGTANAVSGGTVTAYPTLAAGQCVKFIANATNTGATTIAITGQSTVNLVKSTAAGTNVALAAGNKVVGQPYFACYTGTAFAVLNPTIVAADIPTLNQNTTGSAGSFTGSLVGDVTGTQGATVVGKVNGGAFPASSPIVAANGSNQPIASIPCSAVTFTGTAGSLASTWPSLASCLTIPVAPTSSVATTTTAPTNVVNGITYKMILTLPATPITFAFPSNVNNPPKIPQAQGVLTCDLYGDVSGNLNVTYCQFTGGFSTCAETAGPGTSPLSGSQNGWCDNVYHLPKWENSSGNLFTTILFDTTANGSGSTAGICNSNEWQIRTGRDGVPGCSTIASTNLSDTANLVRTTAAATLGAFLYDFSASTIKVPTAASFVSTASSMLGYDSSASRQHLWVGSDDLILGRATTDTLTNKTYDTAGTGNSFKINGTAITAVSGTGAVCLGSGSTCASGGGNPTLLVANAAVTGTTTNTLTKLNGVTTSTAVIAATTDTGGIVGVCTSGCTTTGNATITWAGSVTCVFDGSTTINDYVQISSSTGGDCHDAGASYPTSGQVIGRVLGTNVGAGSYSVDLYPSEIQGGSGGGGANANGYYLVNVSTNAPTNAVIPFTPKNETTTYQVLAADFASYKTIYTNGSSAFTITLVASGSQPAVGQTITIVNYGYPVTIARSGQNINGGTASLIIPQGCATAPTSGTVTSDGTNYYMTLAGSGCPYTVADGTSITPDSDYIASGGTIYQSNSQAAGTLTINADGGSPVNGKRMILKINACNSSGGTQTYSWNSGYVSGNDITLPATTSCVTPGTNLIDQLGFIYDSVKSKWEIVAVARGY